MWLEPAFGAAGDGGSLSFAASAAQRSTLASFKLLDPVEQFAYEHGAGVVETEVAAQPLGARYACSALWVIARLIYRFRTRLDQSELQVAAHDRDADARLPR
jgi:hypothetical protein